MKRPPHAIYVALALAALLASVFVFKRYLPYTGAPAMPKTPPAVVMAMDGVSMVGLGRGGKLWTLKAKHVEVAQNRTTTTLTGITEGQVFSGKKVAFRVRAGKAVYDTGSGYLSLDGGIHIRGERQKLTTGGAFWSPATQMLRSTGPVVFESEWTTLKAERLALDVQRKELSLVRVRGSIFGGGGDEGLVPKVGVNAN